MLASVTMCNDDIRNNSKISDLGYLTLFLIVGRFDRSTPGRGADTAVYPTATAARITAI